MNRYFIIKKLFNLLQIFFFSIILTSLIFFLFILLKYTNTRGDFDFDGIRYKDLQFNYVSDYNLEDVNNKVPSKIFQARLTKYSQVGYILDEYFKENNSPLYGYGQTFVDACKKYNAPEDCTLLPAIAKIETNLCTTDISAKQHNCWGFGGSGKNRILYKDFTTAIFDITNRLMQGYGKAFFEDPELGELFYCGSHCNLWGDKVKAEQNKLKGQIKGIY